MRTDVWTCCTANDAFCWPSIIPVIRVKSSITPWDLVNRSTNVSIPGDNGADVVGVGPGKWYATDVRSDMGTGWT